MSLLAPLFLLGLLAALLPWWLHRLSASNPPQHDFGSTRFLTESPSASSKRRRIRYLALLALRVLFLALLSLLFAQPVIDRLKSIGVSSVRHILLIDTSLSQNLDGRWQRTLDIANEVIDSAAAGDEVRVISGADQFVQLESDNTKAAAKSQLAKLKPGNARLDYGRIASAVAAAISEEGINNQLHIITDTQATAMPDRFTALAVDKVQKISVYSSAADNDTNVAVTAKLQQLRDNTATVVAIVNNYGDATERTLMLKSGNQTIARAELSLSDNTSLVHRFDQVDLTGASAQLDISISPTDALSLDDSWIVPLPLTDKTEITVLVNNNERTVSGTYAQAAIESDNRFNARLVEADRFAASDTGSLVIVPDASDLSDRAATRLSDYIEDGGNVLIAAGSLPHGAKISSLLGLAPGSTNDNAEGGRINTVGAIDNAHQTTADLVANWRSISVIRHLSLQTRITDRNIIDMSDGSPLLIERRVGAGNMLILTTALNTEWTDLPTASVFVAFVIKSIDYLGGDTSSALYQSTGDVIAVNSGTQLIDPNGEPMRDLSDISERTTISLDQPGIYQLRNSAGTQPVAVNGDTRESDITTISDESLNDWQQITTAAEIETNSTQSAQSSRKGFWLWLLPLLLCIALIESLYSHRHLRIRREA